MIPRLISVGMGVETAIMWLTIVSVIEIPASFAWGFFDQKFRNVFVVFTVLSVIAMIFSILIKDKMIGQKS